MKNLEMRESSQRVRVAVNIRPLVPSELVIGCTDCITVVPGQPQVHIGSHVFTYDYVYGNAGSPSTAIYDDCVAPLLDALFHGYNATVLAYGQTGSGKTYTMGTNYSGEGSNFGIIPKVMESIFRRVETMKESTEFLIKVSFIEIFKEEVFDLLNANSTSSNKVQGAPTRVPIQIRETVNGGITLVGVIEPEVKSKEEMAYYISRGSLSRVTGSTSMYSQSSRSHAIFTITMEQKKIDCSQNGADDDILCAKLHLVDLAGSERAKRIGADAVRFKEGIHINKGLLALGNVISALGDARRRKGGHVPYRDSKLTRMLQDSLGGNSKTLMIACVSPAHTNAEESLNTLRYAYHARNIQNKTVLNKEGRRNEYEMHQLLALNQRQKMVLQRKTEEASMATKRLKELLESQKASSHETSDAANGNSSNIQALMQAIEHELDVTVRVHEVRTEYERQMEERSRMANEVARLKEETEMLKQTNLSNCPESMSPGARNSRIFALENMLATSSSTLVSMASQLSEAEERERVFSGRGRWNQVHSLADAKNIMNYLFNLASSSRCSLRDKEVEVREKETEIRDLKGKVQELTILCRQLETQNGELTHQLKMQKSAKQEDNDYHDLNCRSKYDLRKRKRGNRASTSESEHSDTETTDDEWVKSRRRSMKKRTKSGSRSSVGFNQSGLRCICSKFSSCKTQKCQCRAAGGICRTSCRCLASKCTNREPVIIKEDLSQSSMSNTEGRGPGTDETEQDRALASHGAMLL